MQRSCHVAYKRNYYSVSHLAVGRTVDLRVTDTAVEAFLAGERLATHPLFPSSARNRYSTHAGDLPEGRPHSDWDAGRIRRWADRVGPSCREAVDRIFRRVDHEERGFDAALAALRPGHRHTRPRLERACAMALASGLPSPRYRHLRPILETNRDLVPGTRTDNGGPGEDEAGCVRGADFYGEA